MVREAASDADLRRELFNPYSLCPPDSGACAKQTNITRLTFDSDFAAWWAPFVISAINVRVDLRSNVLLDHAYGREFLYDEAILRGAGKGFSARVKAIGFTAGLGGFVPTAVIPPSR